MARHINGINEMLVSLFNHVMDVESKAVITEEFKDITNNDMHIIEAVGISEPRKMSDIAKILGVTVGTLTTNMNGLEKKNYIIKERSTEDKRVVFVTLTERGRKAFFHHRDFHKNMIKAVVVDLDDEEKRLLYKCLVKLDSFFRE
ncbi:MAG: MarR family transcriptional regulator [Lachnospiraceae bacterium]|nr:MarR family transcriptional regulator [Lachnospiraceae bacterium]